MSNENSSQSNAILTEILQNSIIITFNRPEIRSPLSVFVLEELNVIIDQVWDNPKIRNVIFTGNSDVFASGADLREIAAVNSKTAKEFAVRGQNLMSRIENLDKKTIAAINGFCFGGALDLALSCRIRIASPQAQFCHPGAGLGIMTGWGGTQKLPRLVGEAAALEIFLTAKRFGAREALKIGLIDVIADNPFDYALKNF